MKIAILVTHLLGTGHLTRAMTLARAFAKVGHQPVVISGGLPVAHLNTDGITLVQLPAVKSDGVDFSRLLTPQGDIAGPSYLTERQSALSMTIAQIAPDALITELFPFGRRILKDEFLAVLEQCKKRPKPPYIFASIRDILAPPSKPKKAVFADDTLSYFYDAVLVHSDPQIMPLDLSWPVSTRLAAKLRYTGFVAPPAPFPHPQGDGAGEVLVSAGGGDVGMALFNAARSAASRNPTRRWRLLVGGQNSGANCDLLNHDAPTNLIAQVARPDFRQMLHHAAVSVSLCGYNTALDILQTGCPAVFVPFDDGNEVEQGIRATALAQQPGIERLTAANLDAPRLLDAVARAIAAAKRPAQTSQMNGAQRSVEIVEQICGGHHGG